MKNNRFFTPFTLAVLAIYFFSGACSLTYEVIWQRLLKLILGNTTYATSITVAVFMGGLALGALLVRKKADAIKNKLLVYGVIELFVAFFALLVPAFLKGMDWAYIFIFQGLAPSPQSFTPSPAIVFTLHIVVSVVVLAIPAILMGTTLPILSSMIVRNPRHTGWETGVLYSVNTFGALLGVGATGFALIRLLGVYPAFFIGIGLNIGIAILAIILSRYYAGDRVESAPQNVPGEARSGANVAHSAVFIWLFVMGFVALGCEIVWIRTVVHLLKAEIYTFSSVLCVYLCGYAAGVFTGGILVKKTSRPLDIFYFVAPLVGLCAIVYLPALTRIFDTPFLWNYGLLKFLLGIFSYLPHLYMSTLFFFLPSFCMGVCFPLLVQALRNTGGRTGDIVSKAYGINTLGCVLGSVVTGFVLIPFLGTQASMILLGCGAMLAGLSVLFFIKKGIPAVFGFVIPALCLVAIAIQPKDIFPRWINKCEGKGTYEVKLLDFIEGITTTASVHRYSEGSTVISTAGINVAGDALPLRQTQKIQGHFPVIMHGKVRSILTVGFGTGELTKTLTFHGIPDITCVEISPEMVRLSRRYFSGINLGTELEKKVNMVYMDAKNFMHLTNKKFDVIENDCVWPGTFAESSSLYTREYFMDARRCLNDSGLFSTWMTLDLPETTLLSIVRTFSSVFENTLFVYPNYAPDRHILLVGQKIAHPYGYLDAMKEFEKPAVRESLSLIGIRDLNDLLGSILADYSSLGALSGKAAMNSDYFPFVEFDMNRARLIDDRFTTWKNLKMMLQKTRRVDYDLLLSFAGLDSAALMATRGALAQDRDANEYLLESFCMHSPDERLSLVNKGLVISPRNNGLLRMRQMLTGNRE